MNVYTQFLIRICTVLILLGFGQPAMGHMMVAQHGTLNVVDDGVFMVLSLPVTAFEGVDDDEDNKLSLNEFKTYRHLITEQVIAKAILKDQEKALPLQGVMLSPVTDHDYPDQPVSQLIVIGKYALKGAKGPLNYGINLFGHTSNEQHLKITATNKSKGQKHTLSLTPKEASAALFAD